MGAVRGTAGKGDVIDINIVHVFHDGGAGWHSREAGERHDCRGRASNNSVAQTVV